MTKKIITFLLALSLSATFVPINVRADATAANTMNAAKDEAEARAMLNRLHEIEALTKTNLTRTQKKELRKEVRGMKEKMKSMRPGIYLSIAAIIIILLILILIL